MASNASNVAALLARLTPIIEAAAARPVENLVEHQGGSCLQPASSREAAAAMPRVMGDAAPGQRMLHAANDSSVEAAPIVGAVADAAEDAGCPVQDASSSDANGGHPDEDAGRPDEDAGHSDGGPGHPDEVAGGPEEDAGSPEEDSGRPVEPERLSVNNGRRYLGGGISLPEGKFNWVMDKAKSDSRCCILLARCLYKDEDLVNRSVTGQPSRRNLKHGAVKRKPNTPAKVDAIKVLTNVKKRKTTVPDDEQIGKARFHLSNFLSENNRPSKAAKGPKVPLTPPVPLVSPNEN